MNLTIEPQNRKSLTMLATPDGVKVQIPSGLNPADEMVAAFIGRGMAELEKHCLDAEAGTVSKAAIRDKVLAWADRLGVKVGRIQIRPMRRKWGSASSQGNLTIAEDIVSLPETLVDYLIVHELAHLKFANHGKGFQLLMDMTLPDWRRREKQLAAWMVKRTQPGCGLAPRKHR